MVTFEIIFILKLSSYIGLSSISSYQFTLKDLFARSIKNFLRRTFFFVSLMYAENFLLCAENFLRSKFCLKKQNYV